MIKTPLYPRFAQDRLQEALQDAPLTLLHGPRQCGKTTLAKAVGAELGYSYLSLDEPGLAAAAQNDPHGFVADLPPKAVIDEIQHAPQLFAALKLAVDRDPRPGRAILTGSANVLLLPRLSESLAGRLRILRLYPLAQAELQRQRPSFLGQLFGPGFKLTRHRRLGPELKQRVAAGGFPRALAAPAGHRRREWCLSYVQALLEKDLREHLRPAALAIMPKLLATAAAQTARLFNLSDLAAPFQASRASINAYTALLERVFLLEPLPAWHRNRLSRLVKSSKLHLADSGLACALLGLDAEGLKKDPETFGQLAESFVVSELRKQTAWAEQATSLFHYRDKDRHEVDLVLERGPGAIAGLEIKTAGSADLKDCKGLIHLAQAAGQAFVGGVVLYDGELTVKLAPKIYAVPLVALWEG